MTDRQVKTTLSVQMQQYIDGMKKASKATRETATEAQKLADQRDAFQKLGRTTFVAGTVMAAGLGVAVAKWAEFDQAMSNVNAVLDESVENQERLKNAALEAGGATVFTAREAANAQEELAKAGINTANILSGALAGALDLAASGELEVARAAEITGITLKQFNLEGSQAGRVADVLSAGANKAVGSVEDLAQGLKFVGPVTNSMNVSLEDTVATLALFADQGIIGEQAGTSLRGMLSSLTSPSKAAAKEIENLGITLYDSEGNFLGMENAAGQLNTALAGVTDAQRDASLGIIFGNQQVTAARVLVNSGADAWNEYRDAVEDAGVASRIAEARLDNLAGDWEKLTGAVDTALIKMGEAADGPLRFVTQQVTELVDAFNELPSGGQQAVFWIGAVAAAGSTAFGAYLLLVPKIAEFNRALDVLGPKAQSAARGVGRVASVAGGAAAGVALAATGADLLTEALAAVGDTSEVTANKVKTASDAIALLDAGNAAASTSNLRLATEQVERLGDVLDGIGADGSGGIVSATTLTSVRELGAELGRLAESDLPAAQEQFALLANEADLTVSQQSALLDLMEPYRAALTKQATASGDAASEQELLSLALGDSRVATVDNEDALRALAGQAGTTGNEVEGLADQIRNFGSATLSQREANRAFQQAFDDLTTSIEENGATLDTGTQKGRDNQAALDDLAASALDLAAATYERTGSEDDAADAVQRGRDALIRQLKQLGITGDEAEAYADKLGLIPSDIETYLDLQDEDARRTADQFIRDYDGRSIALQLTADQVQVGNRVFGGLRDGRAGGGAIHGPGTGTSDTAGLYPLSNGEHVLTAADVAAMGGQHAVYAFRDSLHGGGPASGSRQGPAVVIEKLYARDDHAVAGAIETAQRRAMAVAGV